MRLDSEQKQAQAFEEASDVVAGGGERGVDDVADGYNFRLVVKWLRLLWLTALSALWLKLKTSRTTDSGALRTPERSSMKKGLTERDSSPSALRH